MTNKRVLVISDMHVPYHHPNLIRFLTAIKKKYNPDRVICIGDEVDFHSISFHDHDPELMNAAREIDMAISTLKPIYRLFPKVDVLESNHGSLVYRKAMAHGLPKRVFKTYGDILESPKGWRWHYDLTIKLSDNTHCYFHHGKAASGMKVSQSMGMKVVQGHYHESFKAEYWGNPLGLMWSMQVGCLVDRQSLALAYAKNNLKKQMIGCGIILDGMPHLLPLIMDKRGRWTGVVP